MSASRPTHRRRGILTRMMRWLLDQAAERGEPVVDPARVRGRDLPALRVRAGARSRAPSTCDRSAIPVRRPAEPLGRVRLVDGDEAMRLIPPIFDRVRLDTPGAGQPDARRSGASSCWPTTRWRRTSASSSRPVLEVDGEPRGYAIYRVKSDWGDRGPKNVAHRHGGDRPRPGGRAGRSGNGWPASTSSRDVKAWRHPCRTRCSSQLADPRRLGLTVARRALAPAGRPAGGARGAVLRGPAVTTLEVTDAFRPVNAGRWR